MTTILGRLPKWVLFGISGALGGILGALVGELVFLISQPGESADATSPKAVCLLIDCSGSMGGAKLDEVKRAAVSFAARQDLTEDRLAVLGFESSAHLVCPLSGQLPALESGISQLRASGGTHMAEGLRSARLALMDTPNERHVLLFTDGMPNSQARTLAEANRLRSNGIGIVAVATADADRGYLSQIAGDRNRVMTASVGSFETAFRWADSVIRGGVVDHISGPGGLVRTTAWGACLAICIAMLLVMAQNGYLRRRLFPKRSASAVILGGGGAGALGGAAGEYAYAGIGMLAFFPRVWLWTGCFLLMASLLAVLLVILRNDERLRRLPWKPKLTIVGVISGGLAYLAVKEITTGDALPRILGLSLLGALLGFGLAFCIPNLKKRRGALGGVTGGLAAGIAFVWISSLCGDTGGRLLGGFALGLCIGLMIALVESLWRTASLQVVWGPGNSSTINLGDCPVMVGSGSNCQVFLADGPPVAAAFELKEGKILCRDGDSTEEVTDGTKKTFAPLEIVVHAQR